MPFCDDLSCSSQDLDDIFRDVRASLIQWGTPISICWSLLTSPALAEELVAKVDLHCEDLNQEQESEVEARLLGELLVNGLKEAQMTLACEQGRVEGHLSADGRKFEFSEAVEQHHSTELIYQVATRLIDSMLESTLGIEPHERAEGASVSAQPPVFSAPGSGSRQAALAVGGSRDVAKATSEDAKSTYTEQKHSLQGTIGTGLALQVVGGEESLLLGPRFDGSIEFRSMFGARVEAAFYFPTRHVDEFSLQDFRMGADIYLRLLSWWRIGTFGLISVVRARGPDEFVAGTSHSVRPAFGLFTEVSGPFARWEPYVGLGVSWVNARRVLEVEGEVRSGLPAVQGLINFGARLRVGGYEKNCSPNCSK